MQDMKLGCGLREGLLHSKLESIEMGEHSSVGWFLVWRPGAGSHCKLALVRQESGQKRAKRQKEAEGPVTCYRREVYGFLMGNISAGLGGKGNIRWFPSPCED